MQGGILIIDYGSQYTQLIARRIRENSVYCEIHPYNKVNLKLLKTLKPNGFVLSGGPNSTLDKGSPKIPKCMKFISKPILGICYGLQLLIKDRGGKIRKSLSREYGYAKLKILCSSEILPKKIRVGKLYRNILKNNKSVTLQHIVKNCSPCFWLNSIFLKDCNKQVVRDLGIYLESVGIEVRSGFWPLNKQSGFKFKYVGSKRVSDDIFNKSIILPSAYNLKEKDIRYIQLMVKNLLDKHNIK